MKKPDGEARKQFFVHHSVFPPGLWCNSSISSCEGDGPSANPGFLTNSNQSPSIAEGLAPIQPQPRTVEVVWQINRSIMRARFFAITSKCRRGFPSETQGKCGFRVVNGNKELREKLGRNDPCPCGSGRSF